MTRAESIRLTRRIGQEHRPVSVSVVRNSVTCDCGFESTNIDGLEEHRATLIVEALLPAVQCGHPNHGATDHDCGPFA